MRVLKVFVEQGEVGEVADRDAVALHSSISVVKSQDKVDMLLGMEDRPSRPEHRGTTTASRRRS